VRRLKSDVLFVAIGAVAFLFFFGLGSYTSWQHHSGVPARMRVAECQQSGQLAHCSGVWQSGPPIDIQGADEDDAGRDVDVHVHRSIGGVTYAVSDDPYRTVLFYGLACMGGIVAVGSLVRMRRRATRP
jgi:hypothetical protein